MEQSNQKQSYSFTPDTGDVPYQALPYLLRDRCQIFPDREAIVFLDNDGQRSSLKYKELYDKAFFLAKGLLECGVEKGEVVAISNKNSPEWIISTLGVQMVAAVPLHFFFKRQDGTDITEILHSIPKCSTLIIDPGEKNKNINICKNFLQVFEPNGSVSSNMIEDLHQLFVMTPTENGTKCSSVYDLIGIGQQSSCKLPLVSPDDIAGIFLTSGSTGIPKAVPMTHFSLLKSTFDFAECMQLSDESRHYNDRPFSWVGGYPAVFIAKNSTVVTASNIVALKSIEEINSFTVSALETENCTSALVITPCLHDLMHGDIPQCKQWPLKVVATGGLPVESTCTKAAGIIADKVVVLYGATEIGMASALEVTASDKFEDYSIGFPVPGVELKIVDDEGNIVPRGTTGELYLRRRDRFQGYLNNKQKTKECTTSAGWYKTDDIAVMREDGNAIVTGRKSDMMILGGLLVSPIFIESIVKNHPSVVDVYIYPVHDDKSFQRAYAAVVTKSGESLSETELKNYIMEQQGLNKDSFIDKRQIPEHFLFYKELPHTHNGKLDRKATALMIKSTKNLGFRRRSSVLDLKPLY